MNLSNYATALTEIGSLVKSLAERTLYLPPGYDPFAGVLAQPMIDGKLLAHEPLGPFKDKDDATDYFVHKRDKHLGRRPEFATPDAQMYMNPGFGFQILTVREYVARNAAQIQVTALAILVGVTEAPAEALRVLPAPKLAMAPPVEEIELLDVDNQEDGA